MKFNLKSKCTCSGTAAADIVLSSSTSTFQHWQGIIASTDTTSSSCSIDTTSTSSTSTGTGSTSSKS